jgi:transposase
MWVHAGPGGDGHHRPAGPERFTERSLERDEHATPACGRERPMPSWRRCRPGSRRWRPRNARLLTEQTKLSTERDILRRAAKYFAGETRW